MKTSRNFSSIFIPVATVFISSFFVMVLELVAGRLIARQLGSSLYTWTSVIGVVLTGITIGYYSGGVIADKFNAKKALSALFAIGSIACLITVILNNVIGDWLFLWKLSWPVRVFCHVSLLFLLQSILLGAISPVVAKMALDKGLPQGRTVGDIYAWGAAGSIAGTFAAGFYLIAAIGTVAIIWLVGACLAIMAVLYRKRFWPYYLWLAAFIFMLIIAAAPTQWCQNTGGALLLREPIDPSVIYHSESQYCYIAVKQLSSNPDKRIFLQDKLLHSSIIMGDINDLQYFHTVIFAAVTHGLSKDKKTLSVFNIGGGGYVFPQYVEHNWPGSRIDVAEIDPAVTEAATQAFGLRKDTTINTITMDARNYVDGLLEKQRNGEKIPQYDFIYEDAFSDYSVPYQLVTKEFHDKIFKILTDDGVYMINMIDVFESGLFLGAYIETLQKTFPFIYIASEGEVPHIRTTFSIIASKRQIDLPPLVKAYRKNFSAKYLTQSDIQLLEQKVHQVVLTDDYAPVENLLIPVVLQSSKELLATRYLNEAEKLEKQQKWKESINAYEKAVGLNPTMALKAYNEIGLMQAYLGSLQESINAFQKAVDSYNPKDSRDRVIASVYLNMGTLLQRMGKTSDANDYLAKAVNEFRLELEDKPYDALLWSRLGDALATMGDYKLAAVALDKAVMLQPDNLMDRLGLAKMLEFQERIPEAIDVVKKGLDIALATRQQEMAAHYSEYLKSLEQQIAAQQKNNQTN
jgi:tetratricopeptide (TPR) repeat protein/MFS family permease